MITPSKAFRKRATVAVAGVAVTLLALTACASGGGSSANSGYGTKTVTKLTYLKNTENTTIEPILNVLAKNECKADEKALPLQISNTPQATIDSRVATLASQNALPVAFATGGTPSDGVKLYKAGKLVDFTTELKQLGVYQDIAPGSISVIKELYGDNKSFDFLPFQYNIEGIFYNKKIFAENNISIPTTWNELLSDSAKLKAAGITPLSASGQQGWPITRLIGNYIFRDLGPNAMEAIADGKAKLTDPDYVKAAAQVADLGKKGYFNNNVASLDYAGSINAFLTGQTAMMYMGSWLLANINDPTQNKVGVANIGFMPFPAVSGGKGSIDQYPANVGLPQTFGKATFTPKVASWLKCITANFGTEALKQGQLTGFKATKPVTGLSAVTKTVQTKIATSTSSVLWFEALFNAKASSDSNTDAALLVTGQMTPLQFMTTIQTDLNAGS